MPTADNPLLEEKHDEVEDEEVDDHEDDEVEHDRLDEDQHDEFHQHDEVDRGLRIPKHASGSEGESNPGSTRFWQKYNNLEVKASCAGYSL